MVAVSIRKRKILFWTAGRGYSSWHGIHPGAVFETGQRKIAEYLDDLTRTNYPYDIVQWRYNVYRTTDILIPQYQSL